MFIVYFFEVQHLSLTIATHVEEARARLGERLLESRANLEATDHVHRRESAEDDVDQGWVQVRKRERRRDRRRDRRSEGHNALEASAADRFLLHSRWTCRRA